MRSTFMAATRFGWLALVLPLLAVGGSRVLAADANFEAQLIWATNDKTSPNPKHKEAEAEMRKRLAKLPLKWANYFEVNRKSFTVSLGATNRVVMSEKASLEVKLLDVQRVEVLLYGKKGDVCTKHTQPMPKDEILVFGGESPGENAWLVTLKRTN
jgi:hypothetical protein